MCILDDEETPLKPVQGDVYTGGISIDMSNVTARDGAVSEQNTDTAQSLDELQQQRGKELFHNLPRESRVPVITTLMDSKGKS